MKINILNNRSDFIKNLIKLGAGTSIAQAIPFLFTPVLSRLYEPSQYGDFALFMSIIGVIGVISTLRYEMAIITSKTNDEAKAVLKLSFIILFLISLLSYVSTIVFISDGIFSNITNTVFHLSFIGIFLIGATNIFQHWFNRCGKYSLIAKAKVATSLANVLFSILLGYIGFINYGLIFGALIGSLVFFSFFIYSYLKENNLKKEFNLQSIKTVAKKHKDFPRFNTIQALLDTLQLNGILYLLTVYFNSTIIGFYAFAIKVLQAPMWLIGTSIAQIFYKEASFNFNDKKDLTPILKKSMLISFIFSLPISLIILFFGSYIFSVIFGVEWENSGKYASILVPFFFTDLIKYTISQTLIIVGKVKHLLFISIFANIIIVICCQKNRYSGC